MRNSRPASVRSIRSTTPTSSTSPVNIQTAPPSSGRRGVDRHLVVPEAPRLDEPPAWCLGRPDRRGGTEGVERTGPENEGCPKDNQTVDQCALHEGGGQLRSPFDEEGSDPSLPQGKQRVSGGRGLDARDPQLFERGGPLGV